MTTSDKIFLLLLRDNLLWHVLFAWKIFTFGNHMRGRVKYKHLYPDARARSDTYATISSYFWLTFFLLWLLFLKTIALTLMIVRGIIVAGLGVGALRQQPVRSHYAATLPNLFFGKFSTSQLYFFSEIMSPFFFGKFSPSQLFDNLWVLFRLSIGKSFKKSWKNIKI